MKKTLIALSALVVVGGSIWFVVSGDEKDGGSYGMGTGTEVASIGAIQ